MEKGLVFAILAAVSFSISTVYLRKAVSQTGESFTAVITAAFTGIPLFAVLVFFSGEWSKLCTISGRAIILLGIAGIIHFVAGRLLAYNAYRLIGANKTAAFLRSSPFYTLILGFVFLNESITVLIILGVLLIVGGAILVSIEKKAVSDETQGGLHGAEFKGILAALGGALCWGISPVLVKPAIEEVGSPFVGAFVSYSIASIVIALLLFRQQHREQIVQARSLTTLIPLAIGGIFTFASQALVYTALSHSPAGIVSALIGTNVLFVLVLSFIINRNIEVFTRRVILGVLITAIGASLLSF